MPARETGRAPQLFVLASSRVPIDFRHLQDRGRAVVVTHDGADVGGVALPRPRVARRAAGRAATHAGLPPLWIAGLYGRGSRDDPRGALRPARHGAGELRPRRGRQTAGRAQPIGNRAVAEWPW